MDQGLLRVAPSLAIQQNLKVAEYGEAEPSQTVPSLATRQAMVAACVVSNPGEISQIVFSSAIVVEAEQCFVRTLLR